MSDILTETTCPLEMLGEDDDNRCRMGRDSTENSPALNGGEDGNK